MGVRSEQPQAMQLRYLTTLQGMATDRSSLIVFPLPLDLIIGFTAGAGGNGGRVEAGARLTRPPLSLSPPGLAGGA